MKFGKLLPSLNWGYRWFWGSRCSLEVEKTTCENPATDVLQRKKNGWFRLVYLKDREPVVFLFLVYKWFTLNDPPTFMSFTYFVGFIFWTSMFGFGIVFHWVDVFFVHNYWGKTTLDKIWQTPEFSKHLDDPPKTNISIHFLPWKKESHLQPVCWLAVSSPVIARLGPNY